MKLKNRSSAKKRVRVTGRKKVLLQKAGRSHLLINKAKRQKKKVLKGLPLPKANTRSLKKMLPYL